MNTDFIVTNIERVIFVGKEEYPMSKIEFNGDLLCNELILHLSGKGTVHFNGKILKCKQNTVRFLPKGKNLEYTVEDRSSSECIDIFFNTDCPVSQDAFALNMKDNLKIRDLFKKIFSVWVAKNEGYYFECISLLYKIFSEMQKSSYIPQKQYAAIEPAISYIEENFLRKKISVAELAQKCNISESYLKKLFIKKYSVSPVKYIIQMKINYASDLLRFENYSVTKTAYACGYDSIYFFSRQFKEYTGISPANFKNKFKSSK